MSYDVTKLNFMSLISVNFIVFLAIITVLYYKVNKKNRNIYLLTVSYFFYVFSEVRLCFILPIITIISFYTAKVIDDTDDDKKRKMLFLFGLFVNIGVLLVFKYYNFFTVNITAVTGIAFKKATWILPLGISFFTFQSAGYIIDVYLKKVKAEKSLLKYSLFLSFFAYVTSGPINRTAKLMPQFDKDIEFDYSRTVTALQLMAIGFFKKIAVADILIKFINQVTSNVGDYTGLMLIFTAFMYSFWLYADFSGYSDIARGIAKLFGFEIIDNFNTPYLSTSFSIFWSRWHISLSSWFQDYIFTPFVWINPMKNIPLVGKFFQKPPILTAIAIVFLTSGLWHGASWTFVVWGGCHALYRIGEDLLRKYYKKPNKRPKPLEFWLKVCWVFTLVSFSQIFFASRNLNDAFLYISKLFTDLRLSTFISQWTMSISKGFDATPLLIYAYIAFSLLVTGIMIAMDWYRFFKLKGKCLTNAFLTMNPVTKWVCYYTLIALIMAGFIMNNGGFGSTGSFLYQNF